MKKLLLLLLLLPLIVGSCSKDDDDKNDSLEGTTWEANEVDGEYTYKSTIKFQKSTFNYSGYEALVDKKLEFSGSGTYTYDHPNVVMVEDGETIVATIANNKLTASEDGIVYIKK
ncbi:MULTISPECIES: hypothetical protein [unclassified Dysgonomonas]|uniref:hypothetical protein n=1 Tax=unclassified Dysgonomonas TaxID=2630389 RepID=UPI0013EE19E5|nr:MULTISPECIES: hypothetical protein [unclassified Dysgonomonas]